MEPGQYEISLDGKQWKGPLFVRPVVRAEDRAPSDGATLEPGHRWEKRGGRWGLVVDESDVA